MSNEKPPLTSQPLSDSDLDGVVGGARIGASHRLCAACGAFCSADSGQMVNGEFICASCYRSYRHFHNSPK